MIGADFDDFVIAAPASAPPPAPSASHHSTVPLRSGAASSAPPAVAERSHGSKLPSSGVQLRDNAADGIGALSDTSSSSSSSDSSDSDSDAENIPVPMAPTMTNGKLRKKTKNINLHPEMLYFLPIIFSRFSRSRERCNVLATAQYAGQFIERRFTIVRIRV